MFGIEEVGWKGEESKDEDFWPNYKNAPWGLSQLYTHSLGFNFMLLTHEVYELTKLIQMITICLLLLKKKKE